MWMIEQRVGDRWLPYDRCGDREEARGIAWSMIQARLPPQANPLWVKRWAGQEVRIVYDGVFDSIQGEPEQTPKPSFAGMEDADRQLVVAELVHLVERFPPTAGQPLSVTSGNDLARVALRWAQWSRRSFSGRLTLRATRCEDWLSLCGSVYRWCQGNDASMIQRDHALVGWRRRFSWSQTRQVIAAVQQLTLDVTAPQRARIDRLQGDRKAALDSLADAQRTLMTSAEQLLELREGPRSKMSPEQRRQLMSQIAHIRDRGLWARRTINHARRQARELEGAISALKLDRPQVIQLEGEMRLAIRGWLAGGEEEAELARLCQRVLQLPQRWEILAENALVYVWERRRPRRWLVDAGFHPAPPEETAEKVERRRRWRTLRPLAFSPPVPMGEDLWQLRTVDMTVDEGESFRRSLSGHRKHTTAARRAWEMMVLGALDEDGQNRYQDRTRIWDESGEVGTKARQQWLKAAAVQMGVAPYERPPRLVPFR
ncbi:MAG: hypothetical protein AAFV53_39320, partial [Myxococcota bacterium]